MTGMITLYKNLRFKISSGGDGAQGLDEQEAELACKRVYDETEKVVDFRKRRVTDIGLNRRQRRTEATELK